MIVKNILQSKGAKVFTVLADEKVEDAVTILNKENIGVVVVVDSSGGVVGIMSERDVIRRMQGDCAKLMVSPVRACMTAKPYTCSIKTTVNEALQLMTKHRIRHVPVVGDEGLLGLISIGDVVKHKISETEEEAAALRDYIAS